MKNSIMIAGIILVLLLVGGFIYFNSGTANNNTTGNSISTSNTNNPQKVVLSYKNGNYYPNTITVKAGQPVQLSLDSSVQGCYRSFTIKELGIQKNLASPSDSLTFTPTQKGTYRFACSMGMGTGTLIVQ